MLSDSEKTLYVKAVNDILLSPKKFKKFRNIYSYKEILEHVDFHVGNLYLKNISKKSPIILENYDRFRINDTFGAPTQYGFEKVGLTSPTTLRYLSVAVELSNLFGSKIGGNVAEIGVGYGGQCLILQQLADLRKYTLPNVNQLALKYLSMVGFSRIVKLGNVETDENEEFDLLISNYAFSELPRSLQKIYLDQVILKSKMGYMIMNSGSSNLTGRSENKYSQSELLSIIPGASVSPEIPLTGPDNYVITWGSSNLIPRD